ncbi:MAG: trehalose-phosphatase, partial [Ilumatobacteraceae bacterium]
MIGDGVIYDDPSGLASLVIGARRPLLIGLDVDGVLAPIVDHADDAVLLPGMRAAVDAVAAMDRVHIAVVSGRSLADLARFEFSAGTRLVGSHGMETSDRAMAALNDTEEHRLAELSGLADAASETAGDGAWVEHKPASVVLHVRQADDAAGRTA